MCLTGKGRPSDRLLGASETRTGPFSLLAAVKFSFPPSPFLLFLPHRPWFFFGGEKYPSPRGGNERIERQRRRRKAAVCALPEGDPLSLSLLRSKRTKSPSLPPFPFLPAVTNAGGEETLFQGEGGRRRGGGKKRRGRRYLFIWGVGLAKYL